MNNCSGVITTGQQIGAGWSPALSVVKALTALTEAKRRGLRPVYWLADEDHDRNEVASVVALHGERLLRHKFQFSAPDGTAAGWLEWTDKQQNEAQNLWGQLPQPTEPTLRGHALALGKPLWELGIKPFCPTVDIDRASIQTELERWRAMNLENDLCQQANLFESQGEKLILDPRRQAAWFSLDSTTGKRSRLESGHSCPKGHWLSPGAALRPLMQSLVLPAEAVVLGPGERGYWRLLEKIWDRVGLKAPLILPRPSVFVLPDGHYDISIHQLEPLRLGQWDHFVSNVQQKPMRNAQCAPETDLYLKPSFKQFPEPDENWGGIVSAKYSSEIERLRTRLKKLDKRLAKEAAEKMLGGNLEKLRQFLFPLNKPQERVLPGWCWLKNQALLYALAKALESAEDVCIVNLRLER